MISRFTSFASRTLPASLSLAWFSSAPTSTAMSSPKELVEVCVEQADEAEHSSIPLNSTDYHREQQGCYLLQVVLPVLPSREELVQGRVP